MRMKRFGTLIALAVAVVSGLGAVLVANQWLKSRSDQPVVVKESVPLSKVVIAAQDLEVGARITTQSLGVVDWPRATVPRGAFEDPSALEGRIAVTRLRAGEPVLAAELAAPGSGVGLVAAIKPGKRAMAILVDEVVGVGGFVLPNTFVDVIGIVKVDERQKKAKTLLKRVEVLAIAQETFTEEGKPKLVRTVTLELAPDEAEKLAMQIHEGPIHLVLRNPAEEEAAPVAPPPPQTIAAKPRLRSVPVLQPRVVARAPGPFTVEVIRGSKAAEEIEFKNVNSEERL
jgi:pilus assembly protein CpaB